MDAIVNTWQGQKRVPLAKALTPSVSRANPNEEALAQAKLNAAMLGAMAAVMVEKGLWTLADAAKACGQTGIMQVVAAPSPTPTPAPAGMPGEWKPRT